MLLDAHTHIDKYKPESFSEISKQCEFLNIQLLGVSMCIPSYLKTVELAKKYDFIIPSFGIHPWNADKYSNCLEKLDEYLYWAKYIGEIGLDKKFLEYAAPFADQEKVFEYILAHPATKGKLLNLHTSGAEREVLYLLQKYQHTKFIVHWYAGELELISEYLKLGGYFSIGVEVLFSKHIQEITRNIPIDRILLETDGPYSYSWLRGLASDTDDMPSLLLDVMQKICEIKSVDEKSFRQQLEKSQMQILL